MDERTGLTNRLQALLKQYFPQALDLCGEDLWRPLATAFLLKWPTLQKLQKARPDSIKQFYYLKGSRSQQLIAAAAERLEAAVALTDEPAVLQSFALRVQLICQELQLLQKTLAQFDRPDRPGLRPHPDREIFQSFPGAGPALAPRLLATLGSERERFAQRRAAAALQRHCPGDQTERRQTLHPSPLPLPDFLQAKLPRIRQGIHPAQPLGRGVLLATAGQRLWASHGGARAGLQMATDHLEMLADRSLYKEAIYEAALKKSGSPLVALLDSIELGKSPLKKAEK